MKPCPRRTKALIALLLLAGATAIVMYCRHGASATASPLTFAAFRSPRLNAQQAEEYEDRLKHDPDNAALRFRLTAYYGGHRRLESPEAQQAWWPHLLWIIRHHPDADFAEAFEGRMDKAREPEAFAEASQLWLENVDLHGKNATVLGNAGTHFLQDDLHLAETFLKEAQRLEPGNPTWSRNLGQAYAITKARTSPAHDEELTANSLAGYEEALRNSEGRFRTYDLECAATLALSLHDLPKAERYAHQLLDIAIEGSSADEKHVGTAIHIGNLLLGRIALARGDVRAAEAFLLKAAEAPGSIRLFDNPPMELAKELWNRSSKAVVTAYLQRSLRKIEIPKMYKLVRQAEAGETPDFDCSPLDGDW